MTSRLAFVGAVAFCVSMASAQLQSRPCLTGEVLDMSANNTLATAFIRTDGTRGFPVDNPDFGTAEQSMSNYPWYRIVRTLDSPADGPDYFNISAFCRDFDEPVRFFVDVDGALASDPDAPGSFAAEIAIWRYDFFSDSYTLVASTQSPIGEPDDGTFDPVLGRDRTGGSAGPEPMLDVELDEDVRYVLGIAPASGPGNGPTAEGFQQGFESPVTYTLLLTETAVPCFITCPAADIAPQFGVTNVNDIITFVTWFNDGDCRADISPLFGINFSGDGLLDVNDIIDFVNSFNAGCP